MDVSGRYGSGTDRTLEVKVNGTALCGPNIILTM